MHQFYAQKINRLATPNGIVIGSSLYDLVQSFSNDFDFQKIESKEMKDKYGYEAAFCIKVLMDLK